MPLLDHFHPPLSARRHWESFHATWTVSLADAITPKLPEGYFAEVQTHAGASGEIDVATFEETGAQRSAVSNGAATATVPPRVETLPAATLTMPAVFPQSFEVRVFSSTSGPTLVAAIELISPGNKDRIESRRAFAAKCASYLCQGISLVIVDIVTDRLANLHDETMRLMQAADRFLLPPDVELYAVAYRPVRRGEEKPKEEIDLWPVSLRVGDNLPTLPLVLNRECFVSVDLEAAYTDACRRRRLA
jgi:hypothetical protein